MKKPLSFDHARMQDRVTDDGDLELHSWDWRQQRSAIEAQLAHCFFKSKDRDSGLLHLWESLALRPHDYGRAVDLFERTSVPLPVWRPEKHGGDAWKQITGRPHGKASEYSWRSNNDIDQNSTRPDTVAVAALGYQLRRHHDMREHCIYYMDALHAYKAATEADPKVDPYLKLVARELQKLTSKSIEMKDYTTANDLLHRAKAVYASHEL